MKLAMLVLVGLLGATQIAAADDQREPQQQPQPQRGMKMRRMLIEQFDRDGDGRLDQRERMRASRALRRMSMRLGQGKRGQQGQQGQRGNRQMRRQKLIQKYDLDGDGNLGPGELPPRVQQRLRRMDRNGDGWLDQRDSATTPAAPRD
jgi:hypothetical protein